MEPVADTEQPELLMNQREPAARIVALAFAAWIFDFYDLVLYSFLLVPVARELNLTPANSSLLSLGAVFSRMGALPVWVLPETRGRSITALD